MEIEFSAHARNQTKRRRISRKRIIETINTGKKEVSYKMRKTYWKQFGQKTLEVVVANEAGKLIIVTSYYTYENKLRS